MRFITLPQISTDVKLYKIILALLVAAAPAAAARRDCPAVQAVGDNISVGVSAGAASPVRGGAFWGNMRPVLAVDGMKMLTPAFGLGAEAMVGFNTSRWPQWSRSSTAVDHSYLGVVAGYDFVSAFSRRSPFAAGIRLGGGWGHAFAPGADHSFFATRAGAFLRYSFSPRMSVELQPSFIWNMSDAGVSGSSVGFKASRCVFLLQAGLRYRFGGGFVYGRVYTPEEIARLNGDVNDMRAEVVAEVAVDNRLNTVYDVFFHSGSAVVEPDQMPNIERVAAHLNQTPASSVLIEGYASADGASDANSRLSEQRAQAVKDILTGRFGIPADRIRAVGRGVGHLFSEESWNRVSVCTVTLPAP